jgi:hypothetical protein
MLLLTLCNYYDENFFDSAITLFDKNNKYFKSKKNLTEHNIH